MAGDIDVLVMHVIFFFFLSARMTIITTLKSFLGKAILDENNI